MRVTHVAMLTVISNEERTRQPGAVDVRESKQSATMKMVFCLVQRGANNIARETAGKSG